MENFGQNISGHNNLTDNNAEQIKNNGSTDDNLAFDAKKDFCKCAILKEGVHFVFGN